ncbi:MAG TPA: zinc-dependent alcohol dehydrogenase family protein [Nocardioidaceae bacterium]|nr:zinc-dependent alcohol dehydrogenase family protein [Nocardioidaceae bacterium]
MKAVRYEAYREPPFLADVPEPDCPDDGVLVRVAATGVCRSDWHAWQGHDPVRLPHTPGHEFAGVIAEVGRLVRRRQVGERVTAPFVCGCGACEYCRDGNAQVCPAQTQPGFTGPGSFAELVAVHAADLNVVPLPDTIDLLTAASLGCRFATAYRALTAHGRLSPDQWIAVHGCGGVGLSAVMIASALGARVVAVDPQEPARRLARELGAETVLDALEGLADPVSQIRELTGGGAHVSLDAVGSSATAAASVGCLRPRGRHVQVGLLLGEDAHPPLPMDQVVAKELEIYGSHGMAARDYPGLLDLVASGALQPGRLVGTVIGLAEAGDALAAMSGPPSSAGITVVRL